MSIIWRGFLVIYFRSAASIGETCRIPHFGPILKMLDLCEVRGFLVRENLTHLPIIASSLIKCCYGLATPPQQGSLLFLANDRMYLGTSAESLKESRRHCKFQDFHPLEVS